MRPGRKEKEAEDSTHKWEYRRNKHIHTEIRFVSSDAERAVDVLQRERERERERHREAMVSMDQKHERERATHRPSE